MQEYIAIYTGCEAPQVLLGYILGTYNPDKFEERHRVEASSMKEACEKIGCGWQECVHDGGFPDELVSWDLSEGYEGYMVIRTDIAKVLKDKIAEPLCFHKE